MDPLGAGRRPRRAILLTATGVAVAVVVAAVVVAALVGRGGRSDDGAAAPAPLVTRAPVAGDRYVALGDSYTTGYLTGPTDTASGVCRRSTANYASQVADALGLRLTDVSCGGATTEDVAGSQRTETGEQVAPQLDAVDADTALVTIGLGLNDFSVYAGLVVTCVQLAPSDPQGDPCTEAVDAQGGTKVLDRNAAALAERLADVVGAVRAKAPAARVVLVGYPRIFPAEAGCDQLPLAAGDHRLAYDTIRRVNDALDEAAAAAGAEYVDVWTPSAGHDICAEDPWIAGVEPQRTDGYAWHPYPEEQQLVARTITARLTGA